LAQKALYTPGATMNVSLTSVALDKASYENGDTAQVTLTWDSSMAPDILAYVDDMPPLSATLSLTDSHGTACSAPHTAPFPVTDKQPVFFLEVTQRCPTVQVHTTIYDIHGAAVGSWTVTRPTLPPTSSSPAFLITVIILAIIAVIVTVITRRASASILMLVFIGGVVLVPGSAGADCGTVTDVDGNVYDTVHIGHQCWMAENLNVGSKLSSAASEPSNNGVIEKWCYDNSTAICDSEGGLYTWEEAMEYSSHEGGRGICPAGWHIPTDTEWHALESYLADPGSDCPANRGELYACESTREKMAPGGCSGFRAVYAGSRYASEDGSGLYTLFTTRGSMAKFLSSTISPGSPTGNPYHVNRFLVSGDDGIGQHASAIDWHFGYSVRCVKNGSGGSFADVCPAPAVIAYFNAVPDTVIQGGTSELWWDSNGATSCDIESESGQVWTALPASGTKVVSPTETTQYTLTCYGSGGNDDAQEIVSVTEPPQCSDGVDNDGDGFVDMDDPGCSSLSDDNEENVSSLPEEKEDLMPAVSLTADTTSIIRGEKVSLSWTSRDVLSCFASGGWSGWLDLDGGVLVSPNDTTIFRLTCWEQDNSIRPACSDGVDNDGDGNIDGHDVGCSDAADATE
jgi:uncharacterized protein (TIGR02145 family)